MKAISLWQPWASAMALGYKTIETRHWSSNVRGPFAIHAAKRWTRAEREFLHWLRTEGECTMPSTLPLGAIVATANLDRVRRSDDVLRELAAKQNATEIILGNYESGRYAWVCSNIVALPDPILFRGAQGWFDVPDSLFTVSPAPPTERPQ